MHLPLPKANIDTFLVFWKVFNHLGLIVPSTLRLLLFSFISSLCKQILSTCYNTDSGLLRCSTYLKWKYSRLYCHHTKQC
ncbi:hypothetical protein DL95DRAFT_164601 [Leptodontidium sp. 2 PMI_412]|nr:hypothetical protein DL95DRAFT_164601 [Leptodontidium sp. 2 PMI_412]